MYILGIGTGRCGTRSLAHLLAVNGVDSVHERKPVLSWEHEPAPDKHFAFAGQRRFADTGFYYLPHVDRLLDQFEGLQVVCMQRDKAATVNSFCRVGKPEWFTARTDGWCRCFPHYDGLGLRAAAARYWDDYYARAAELEGERFRIVPTAALNDETQTLDLLDWLGIGQPAFEAFNIGD